ncbi:MAG: hypothetical protein RLZZ630_1551 [Bacteroidota bacterium]|jgi:carbon monoxide dehydrogenase subunit G
MTRLESNTITIAKNAESVFDFFSDMQNIGRIMPEQVEEFVSEGDTCRFTIKGMASLGLQYAEKTAPTRVVMSDHGKSPFTLKLTCTITPAENEQCSVQLTMDADLNPFLKMVAEKPLTNFLNILLDRFQTLGV